MCIHKNRNKHHLIIRVSLLTEVVAKAKTWLHKNNRKVKRISNIMALSEKGVQKF